MTQDLTIIDRFQALRQRLEQPLADRVEHERSELDQRIVTHITYRAAKIIDALLQDD